MMHITEIDIPKDEESIFLFRLVMLSIMMASSALQHQKSANIFFHL